MTFNPEESHPQIVSLEDENRYGGLTYSASKSVTFSPHASNNTLTPNVPSRPSNHKKKRAKKHRKRHILPGPAGQYFQEQQSKRKKLEAEEDGSNRSSSPTVPHDAHGHPQQDEDLTANSPSPSSKTILQPPNRYIQIWDAMCLSLDRILPSTTTTTTTTTISTSTILRKLRHALPPEFTLLSEILSNSHTQLKIPQIVIQLHSIHAHGHFDYTVDLVDESTRLVGRSTVVTGWLSESLVRSHPEWIHPGVVFLCQNVSVAVFEEEGDEYDDGTIGGGTGSGGGGLGIEKMLILNEESVVFAWGLDKLNEVGTDDFLELMEKRAEMDSKLSTEDDEYYNCNVDENEFGAPDCQDEVEEDVEELQGVVDQYTSSENMKGNTALWEQLPSTKNNDLSSGLEIPAVTVDLDRDTRGGSQQGQPSLNNDVIILSQQSTKPSGNRTVNQCTYNTSSNSSPPPSHVNEVIINEASSVVGDSEISKRTEPTTTSHQTLNRHPSNRSNIQIENTRKLPESEPNAEISQQTINLTTTPHDSSIRNPYINTSTTHDSSIRNPYKDKMVTKKTPLVHIPAQTLDTGKNSSPLETLTVSTSSNDKEGINSSNKENNLGEKQVSNPYKQTKKHPQIVSKSPDLSTIHKDQPGHCSRTSMENSSILQHQNPIRQNSNDTNEKSNDEQPYIQREIMINCTKKTPTILSDKSPKNQDKECTKTSSTNTSTTFIQEQMEDPHINLFDETDDEEEKKTGSSLLPSLQCEGILSPEERKERDYNDDIWDETKITKQGQLSYDYGSVSNMEIVRNEAATLCTDLDAFRSMDMDAFDEEDEEESD